MAGHFITLEGIDGCGKSTQLEMLRRALKDKRPEIIFTREPGGTPLAEQIRALLSSASDRLNREGELFLIAAARAQHVAELIKPALASGRTVISDRFADSTAAFQGYGRGLDLASVDEVNRLATGGLHPDLTLLLDLEPELARARLDARAADRAARPAGFDLAYFDQEEMAFHTRVREGYLKLAAAHPERVRIIDASGSIEAAGRQVLSLIMPLIEG